MFNANSSPEFSTVESLTVKPSMVRHASVMLLVAIGAWCVYQVLLIFSTQKEVIKFGSWILLSAFIFSILVIFIRNRSTSYIIDIQRITEISGIISKKTRSIELMRIQNIIVTETIMQRLFAVGNVTVITQDMTNPLLAMQSIPNTQATRLWLLSHVQEARRRQGFREIAIG